MAVPYQVIGRNLKKAHSTLHLTQEQTAALFRMSALHDGRLEHGERRASLEQVDCFAQLLDTSLQALLFGASDSMAEVFHPEETGLRQALESIAAGCSLESRQQMTDVCQLIAKKDKYAALELYTGQYLTPALRKKQGMDYTD